MPQPLEEPGRPRPIAFRDLRTAENLGDGSSPIDAPEQAVFECIYGQRDRNISAGSIVQTRKRVVPEASSAERPLRRCRSFLRLHPFSRFGSLLQSSQSRTPKPFDELDQLIEGFRAHDIQALRSHSAFIDKARFAQHAEVLRHGRSGDLELPCHGSRVHFAVTNKLHDLEPSLVAQSPNLGQHGHRSRNPCKFYFTLEKSYGKMRLQATLD